MFVQDRHSGCASGPNKTRQENTRGTRKRRNRQFNVTERRVSFHWCPQPKADQPPTFRVWDASVFHTHMCKNANDWRHSSACFLDSSPEHRSALPHRLLSTLPVVLLQVLYLQGSPQSASTSGGPHRSSPNSCSFVEDVLAPKIVSTEDETLRRFSSVAVTQPCNLG